MELCPDYLRAYIQAHIGEIGNAEDVARQLGLPYENLRKTFRRRTGTSLARYIECVRIETAKRLLVETDLLCFEVAHRVGYDREDTAARAFRRSTGLTMGEYRTLAKAHLIRAA